MIEAVAGFRTRTGRAIAIVLSAGGAFVRREEISLIDASIPETGPYHAVMHLPWPESVIAVRPYVQAIERVALEAVRRLARELHIRAIGVVGSPARNLEKIGNEHIRAHAAEGTLFRRVIEDAAKTLGIECHAFTEKEIAAPMETAKSIVQRIGREAGRPWRTDQRLAATAAWLALDSR